jgi:hypothetical protein
MQREQSISNEKGKKYKDEKHAYSNTYTTRMQANKAHIANTIG